jgi:hypothetical protein
LASTAIPADLAIPGPTALSAAISGRAFSFYWTTIPGHVYQVQYKTDLISTNWANAGPATFADQTVAGTTFGLTNAQSLYRVVRTQ